MEHSILLNFNIEAMEQYFLFELKGSKCILVGTYSNLEFAKQVMNVRKSGFNKNKPEYEIAEVYLEKWITNEELNNI